jgi:hypothetical protein
MIGGRAVLSPSTPLWRAGMNELATTATEWYLDDWDVGVLIDESPHDRLCEYIIDPKPFEDSRFDEGGEGD